MPHPRHFAKTTPEKPAYIMASTAEAVTYRELEENSNQIAHLFRAIGLQPDDHIAILMENHIRFFELIWAANRSGIILTPISTHLIEEEIAYILNNCEAKLFITTAKYKTNAKSAIEKAPNIQHFLMLDGTIPGYDSFESLLEQFPKTPIADEIKGGVMFYSSGTTGYPKGIYTPPESPVVEELNPRWILAGQTFKFGPHVKYLSPAPLYHAAPLYYNILTMIFGGTSIIMEKFDAEKSLALIEQYEANYSQWVPIMFVRMLKLPEEIRKKYNVSFMKLALHAAAPCPIEVKEKMIDWWGPVIFEYYGASEGLGMTAITSQEWLENKGSVGKAFVGELFILDEEGQELPPGEIGGVYFKGGNQFHYHNEPEKTKGAYSKNGHNTVGDVGYVNEEGYLFLTDRKHFTIISGGVNIYPQEIENCIINHPKVADVAVFGIPHEEFGQEVKAVVQPKYWEDAGPDLTEELLDFCRQKLSRLKIPRSIDFEKELPRKDNGKLYKRRLVDRYL